MGGDRGPPAFFSEPLSGSLWKQVGEALRPELPLHKAKDRCRPQAPTQGCAQDASGTFPQTQDHPRAEGSELPTHHPPQDPGPYM